MQNCRKRSLAFSLCAVFVLVFCGLPVLADDCPTDAKNNSELMTADIALARPVGTVATVTGFALFVVSSPFSALGGNTKEAWESLVVAPADYTFKRPLGDFSCKQPSNEKRK